MSYPNGECALSRDFRIVMIDMGTPIPNKEVFVVYLYRFHVPCELRPDLVLTLNQTSSDLPQVQVMSNESKRWLPAYITSFDGDKFCNVIFDDGQLETNVITKNIRLIDGHETFDGLQGGSDILVEGSSVDARYKG